MNAPAGLHEYAISIDAARSYARACLQQCDGWTVETLGHNIQSSFGTELTADDCDDIAAEMLGDA